MVVVEDECSVQIVWWKGEAGRPRRNNFAPRSDCQVSRQEKGAADAMYIQRDECECLLEEINAVRDRSVDQFDLAAAGHTDARYSSLQAAKSSLHSHTSLEDTAEHPNRRFQLPACHPLAQPVTLGALPPRFDARCQQGQCYSTHRGCG